MKHQIHGGDSQHGLIHLKTTELRVCPLRTREAIPLLTCHVRFVIVANMLGSRNKEASSAASRIAYKLTGLRVNHGNHHVANMLWGTELTVGACSGKL